MLAPGPAGIAADFQPYIDLARAAALGDGSAVARALARISDPVEKAAANMTRHHLVLATVRALQMEDAEATEQTVAWIGRLSPIVDWLDSVRTRSEKLVAGIEEAQSVLQQAGIDMLILKGPVLAERLYGGLERRSQADVDVMVTRRQRPQTLRLLKRLGYARVRRDQHAVLLRRDDGMSVDVHWSLRAAPAYRIDEHDLWREPLGVTFAGIRARTLSDEYLVLLLALGLAEDAGIGMAKLKQICDLWLLVREIDAVFDWDGWLARRSRERVDQVAAAGLQLALQTMQADADVPRLAAAIAPRAAALGLAARERAVALVAASRHDPASRAWFASVYSGSITLLRLHSVIVGLPHSLLETRPLRALTSERPGWVAAADAGDREARDA